MKPLVEKPFKSRIDAVNVDSRLNKNDEYICALSNSYFCECKKYIYILKEYAEKKYTPNYINVILENFTRSLSLAKVWD